MPTGQITMQPHTHEPSKLDPTVKPFPAYVPQPIGPLNSSPTITSYSSSSGILENRFKGSAHTATSTQPSSDQESSANPFPHAVLLPTTSVQPFGHGWNSSAPSAHVNRSAHSVSLVDTPPPVIVPSRARSPSVPLLPSQTHPETFASMAPPPTPRVYASGGVPFPATTGPRRIPSNYQLSHRPLAHHSSVPSLVNDSDDYGRFTPLIGRRRDVSQWRQGVASSGLSNPVEEEGSDEYPFPSSPGGLTACRSVPALTAPSARPTLSSDYTQSRNIYIPSLPAHWREEDLREFASQYGRIMSIKLDASPAYPPAGSRAFVMFHEVEAAHAFYTFLKKNGLPCEIAKEDYTTVHKSLEDRESSNLYIQGFLPGDSMDFCREVLSPGVIISYSRPTDAQGRPRGILMARLQSRAQAEDAIHRLNDRFVHPVTGNKLQVRIADSDAQKKYKRENDLNRSDKFSSMPDMRQSPAPKILSVNYDNERDWLSRAQVSRETSYASLRSPTSASFGFGPTQGTAPPSPASASTAGQHHQVRHKPSNLSVTGTGGVWSSRTGWTSGTAGGFGMPDAHPLAQVHVAGLWPEIDESSVHF